MSKELVIDDKTYFVDCVLKDDIIEYLLYDSGVNWIATKTSEEVAHTLRLLNKRIKYDVQIAHDTLQTAQPETAVWVEGDNQADGCNALERILKLKYRIKGCPFHFEWCLKRHEDKTLTIQLPVNQVTSLVDTLPAKVAELLNILQRKEQEIKQYRIEKGILRRSTLATSDFDVEKFREQYASSETNVKLLQKFLAQWRAEHGVMDTVQKEEVARPSSSCTENAVKKEANAGKSSPCRSKDLNESPRNKKRKALQNFKTQMTRSLQTSKKQLEYESQSQTLSESEPLSATAVDETSQNEKTKTKHTETISVTGNNDELTESAAKRRRTTNNISVSSTSTPLTGSVDERSNESAQVVPSKCKKISSTSAQRPNTRQRRREYESQGSMLNDTTVNETQLKSVLNIANGSAELAQTVSNKSSKTTPKNNKISKHHNVTGVKNATKQKFSNNLEQFELAKNVRNKSAIITLKNNIILKNNNVTGKRNLSKSTIFNHLEQSKNELSAYVDSMLCQLEAIDKELQA